MVARTVRIVRSRDAWGMAWSRGSLLSAQWLACPWARLIHVILDNHVIDKPQSVRDLLQQMGGKTRLHFLLPYC